MLFFVESLVGTFLISCLPALALTLFDCYSKEVKDNVPRLPEELSQCCHVKLQMPGAELVLLTIPGFCPHS